MFFSHCRTEYNDAILPGSSANEENLLRGRGDDGNNHMKHIILATGVFALLGNTASAHPYLPLRDGSVTTLRYDFKVETDRKEFRQADVRGTMTIKASGWQDRGGHRMLRYVTAYHDIPFMKSEVTVWRREENGAVYSGQEVDGKYQETIELAADVTAGSHWDYNDGVPSIRSVRSLPDVTIASGEKMSDCIEVSRAVKQPPEHTQPGDVTDVVVYCRDIGNVRSVFTQPSPVGLYRTQTLLIKDK